MWQKMLQVGSGGGSTPFQFSTDEQKTNLKWIDSKPIYVKTISISATSDHSSDTTISHGISNIDEVIDYNGVMMRDSASNVKINSFYSTNYKLYLAISRTSVLYVNVGFKGTIYANIYYTKTTD